MVTLEGDLFNIGGAMTGGSMAKKTTSVLVEAEKLMICQKI